MISWVISGVVVFSFFMLGWSGAQRDLAFSKLAVASAITCLPITVIWWIFELIGWPTSLTRMVYPILVLWAPYVVGALAHQVIALLSEGEA